MANDQVLFCRGLLTYEHSYRAKFAMTLFDIAWLAACAAITYWNFRYGINEWTSGLAGLNWRWQASKVEKPVAFYLLMLRRVLGVIGGATFFILGLRFAGWA